MKRIIKPEESSRNTGDVDSVAEFGRPIKHRDFSRMRLLAISPSSRGWRSI